MSSAVAREAVADAAQYLTFTLDQEYYGIELLQVQEIRGYSPITAVPNAPPFVKGVMNLRGSIVPVIDLRSRLGLPTLEYNRFHVIVVVMVRKRIMGILVDAVSDVLNVASTDIQPPPEFGSREKPPIAALALATDKVIMLLDVERVVAPEATAV